MRWAERALGLGPRALLLLALVGCRDSRSGARTPVADSLDAAEYIPRDSLDSALNMPRLITERTVVVFWVHAGDTLNADDAASALEDLNYYTEKVSAALTAYGITLVPTNSDTVYLSLPNRQRRPILLTGLDYPFGYLLIEPGGVERVLAGVYADDELMDEIKAYFDLPDDTTKVAPRITT
jgi:hypothetical protein